jgi:hypothetical protein
MRNVEQSLIDHSIHELISLSITPIISLGKITSEITIDIIESQLIKKGTPGASGWKKEIIKSTATMLRQKQDETRY